MPRCPGDRVTCSFVFFFNDTATTEIYTLSLHDALPISYNGSHQLTSVTQPGSLVWTYGYSRSEGTRLNSSHGSISYAVFCLKKNNIMKRMARWWPLAGTHAGAGDSPTSR